MNKVFGSKIFRLGFWFFYFVVLCFWGYKEIYISFFLIIVIDYDNKIRYKRKFNWVYSF